MVKAMLDVEDQANNLLQNDVELKSKKKKKKHKNKDSLITKSEGTDKVLDKVVIDSQDIEESFQGETHHSKNKKKKKSNKVSSNDNEHSVNDTESSVTCSSAQSNGTTVESEISIPKKKHKKMKKHKEKVEEEMKNNEGCIEDTNEQENVNIKKKKSKKHRLEAKQNILADDVNKVDDKMGLKLYNTDTNKPVEGEELTNKHKKKKRKHREDSDETNETQSSNGNQDDDLEIKALKRKVDEVNSLEEMTEPKKKHKKKKRSKKDQSTDIKQQAAENEEKVYENSDSQNKIKVEASLGGKANENCTTGQWHTADFGDTDRQNKFMKLLGGQKQGANKNQLQAKFKLNAGMPDKNVKHESSGVPMPNMAMNKTQERMYKIALESQFEKAQDFNQNRGVGLGFQTSNKGSKKFHIDVIKSKSVKFDD